VCSGCSGDYAGDFEQPGEPADDSGDGDCPAWTCGDADADGNRPGVEGAVSFEAKANSEWNPQSASLPGSKHESAGEVCEILVSATRIVEIRVIAANCEEIREFRDAEATEMPAAHQHSKALSARYYQTREGPAESASDRLQVPCYRQVAASAAGEFKRWGRWARNALRKSRAKKF
jgi:hypothetical protein